MLPFLRKHFTSAGFRVVLAAILATTPVLASGDPPIGVNIGFDFNWNNNGPAGYTASFIAATTGSGGSLNNCSGALTTSSTGCDFVFSYSIGGVAQTAVASGGAYQTWPTQTTAGQRLCATGSNTAPLTLWNCFNTNSFGQVFLAGTTGSLTAMSMSMTCLTPSGTPPTGLIAVLYQVTPGSASTIPATPIAQTNVNLSTCPTLTSWTGHTFSSADFAAIPINFSGVTLTSGNYYGIFFAGNNLVPGSALPGVNTTPAPSTLVLLFLGLGLALWQSRRLMLKSKQA